MPDMCVGQRELLPPSRYPRHPPAGARCPGGPPEYLVVDSVRHLVPIGELDGSGRPAHRRRPDGVPRDRKIPIKAGAGQHRRRHRRRRSGPPGDPAVAGDDSRARIVALDVVEAKLALAAEVGAHETVPSDKDAARRLRKLTDRHGADVVLDFVGTVDTLALAAASVAIDGHVTIVGTSGGTVGVGFAAPAQAVSVASTYWGSRSNLVDVIEIARDGAVAARVATYTIAEAPKVYQRLRRGEVHGRAVIVPTA